MPGEIEQYPTEQLRDYVRAGVDAGVAAIPLVGGSVQVLADVVLAPSLGKRRIAWLNKLAELVAELEEKVDGFDLADLAGDEVFVTAVADASRIAMGTHLEEKLEILKNCLAHMASPSGRDDFLDLALFGFVDALTPEHFLVLQYLDNPGAWYDSKAIERPNMMMGSPGHLMNGAGMPVVGVSLQIVLRDLNDRGLASTGSLNTTMTADGAWQSLTTELGTELLAFVRAI